LINRYASLNAQKGYEQSRRDDLEALGFILVYLFREGFLPWSGLNGVKKTEKGDKILELK
jgi:hypothetical protein